MALPCGVMGLSAVCDCGISWSYTLTIFVSNIKNVIIGKRFRFKKSLKENTTHVIKQFPGILDTDLYQKAQYINYTVF